MAGGEAAIDKAIHSLRTELYRAMRSLGVVTIEDLTRRGPCLVMQRQPSSRDYPGPAAWERGYGEGIVQGVDKDIYLVTREQKFPALWASNPNVPRLAIAAAVEGAVVGVHGPDPKIVVFGQVSFNIAWGSTLAQPNITPTTKSKC